MNILLLKSLMCMIRITQRRAPHVSMEAMQSTSRPVTYEAFPDAHLTACHLHCSGATAAWRAMLVILHGVTGGPVTSRGLEIWCPVYRHAARRRGRYTLQYCSQDNSRASTDCGSLTRYMRGAAAELLTARSKHFATHNLRLWLRWPSSANYSYSANFWLHYSAEYEQCIFHYSVPNRIRVESNAE